MGERMGWEGLRSQLHQQHQRQHQFPPLPSPSRHWSYQMISVMNMILRAPGTSSDFVDRIHYIRCVSFEFSQTMTRAGIRIKLNINIRIRTRIRPIIKAGIC